MELIWAQKVIARRFKRYKMKYGQEPRPDLTNFMIATTFIGNMKYSNNEKALSLLKSFILRNVGQDILIKKMRTCIKNIFYI
jgi:hypothetical protein